MMMLSAVRKRLTYTNVAVTLALVFAMSGGAYAANRYLITSTRQISPKVLKSLQGKAGPAGVAGAAGVQGPQGAAGPAGPKGETGAPGAKGEPGAAGKEGKEGKAGKEGSPWVAGGTLPSEMTERGVWSVIFTATGGGQSGSADISFNIPLATGPVAAGLTNYIGPEEGEGEAKEKKTAIPGHCKGTVAKPEAVPGNLCVFAAASENVQSAVYFIDPQAGAVGAGPGGAILYFISGAAGPSFAYGDWVVTAE